MPFERRFLQRPRRRRRPLRAASPDQRLNCHQRPPLALPPPVPEITRLKDARTNHLRRSSRRVPSPHLRHVDRRTGRPIIKVIDPRAATLVNCRVLASAKAPPRYPTSIKFKTEKEGGRMGRRMENQAGLLSCPIHQEGFKESWMSLTPPIYRRSRRHR